MPVASSTICANTRVGCTPAGVLPRYENVTFGAPTTTAAVVKPALTLTAFVALAGVIDNATPARGSVFPAAGRAGPDPPSATRCSVPVPTTLIGEPVGTG